MLSSNLEKLYKSFDEILNVDTVHIPLKINTSTVSD